MRRRTLLALLGCTPAAWPLKTPARHSNRVVRIGWLSASSAPRSNPVFAGLEHGLRELGYRPGENLIIEFRKADNHANRLPALAAELARLPVDVIIAVGARSVLRAAVQATDAIPIVMLAVDYDPLSERFIHSLARPGSNITGIFFMQSELMGKRLALLKTVLPQLERVVAIHDSYTANQVQPTVAAAEAVGITLNALELKDPPYDFDRVMATALVMGAQALVVLSSPVFFAQRMQVGAATVNHRLPAVFHFDYYARAGGLMSYGVNLPEMCRYIAGTHVEKILHGADPADLPVERPARFDFAVNLKTAHALGVTLPSSILLQATELIE